MIPDYLDDGFTTEIVPGLYARPMLWSEKQVWKSLQDSDRQWSQIAEYVFGTQDLIDNHRPEIIQVVLGYTAKEEETDFRDLSNTVDLHVLNPGLSELPCSFCRTYCYDHDKGRPFINAAGQLQPLPKNCKVPCETHAGCLKGHWSEPLGLSNERWAKTWRHYWRYRNDSSMNGEIWHRNRMLLDWVVDYGRDSRFDPFVGGSSGGRTADDQTQSTARQNSD
jgi:hypothetical protein